MPHSGWSSEESRCQTKELEAVSGLPSFSQPRFSGDPEVFCVLTPLQCVHMTFPKSAVPSPVSACQWPSRNMGRTSGFSPQITQQHLEPPQHHPGKEQGEEEEMWRTKLSSWRNRVTMEDRLNPGANWGCFPTRSIHGGWGKSSHKIWRFLVFGQLYCSVYINIWQDCYT